LTERLDAFAPLALLTIAGVLFLERDRRLDRTPGTQRLLTPAHFFHLSGPAGLLLLGFLLNPHTNIEKPDHDRDQDPGVGEQELEDGVH